MNFDEYYYRVYLPKHNDPTNRALHTIGVAVTICYILACLLLGCYFWLLASPFIVYPFAWSGHLIFEKNKPAAWSRPIWAKRADFRMFSDTIRELWEYR